MSLATTVFVLRCIVSRDDDDDDDGLLFTTRPTK